MSLGAHEKSTQDGLSPISAKSTIFERIIPVSEGSVKER